jgi:hypothetical protein
MGDTTYVFDTMEWSRTTAGGYRLVTVRRRRR